MKIQYLGTAAAEGWPALFCKCEACERARKLGGKNIRTRSQSIIDDTLLLDFPADTYMHALQFGVDFSSIQHILITHSHEDHFYPLDLLLKAPPYAYDGAAKKIYIYGNAVIVEMLKQAIEQSGDPKMGDYIVPVYVQPFVPFSAGEYKVTPVLASHKRDEDCYLYIIEKDGKRLFYAHDTGAFPQATQEYLLGVHFNAVSLDCTFGPEDGESGHMGLPKDGRIRERMLHENCADANTAFIINHFSHNGHASYEELQQSAAKLGFLTSYDGMTVEF